LLESIIEYEDIEEKQIKQKEALRYISLESLRDAMNDCRNNSQKLLPTDMIETLDYFIKSDWHLNCKVLEFVPKSLSNLCS
jgi:hypothetical protein